MAGAMDRRFQMAEQQLRRKELQREQQEKEGLKRKFASLGALGSGASIKAESQAVEAASRRMSEGSQKIEMARIGEQARQEEVEAQRAFQRGEREAGQTFAGEQAALGRKFATGERESGQTFASGEALKGREFATGERREGEKAASELAIGLQGMKDVMTQQGIDLQQQEFILNEAATIFNTGNTDFINTYIANQVDPRAAAERSGQPLVQQEVTPEAANAVASGDASINEEINWASQTEGLNPDILARLNVAKRAPGDGPNLRALSQLFAGHGYTDLARRYDKLATSKGVPFLSRTGRAN